MALKAAESQKSHASRGGSTGVATATLKKALPPQLPPQLAVPNSFFLFSFCFYKSFTKASFKCPTASECNQEILPHPACPPPPLPETPAGTDFDYKEGARVLQTNEASGAAERLHSWGNTDQPSIYEEIIIIRKEQGCVLQKHHS